MHINNDIKYKWTKHSNSRDCQASKKKGNYMLDIRNTIDFLVSVLTCKELLPFR